jgi:5-methylcytosine-specific restriction endonuclease McrA
MSAHRTMANNYAVSHKAHKRTALGKHTRQQWQQLKALYGFTCLACGRKEPEIKLTRDHVIPIDAGGSDGIENIQPLCEDCNNKKATANVDYRPTYQPSEGSHETD